MSRAKTQAQSQARSSRRANTTSSVLPAKKLNLALCLLLAGITIALYSPVIGHPFIVLDDNDYVTGNLHIHGGLSWRTIAWAFTSTTAANWHPLTWLSHVLDYQLFELNPWGHHLDSVLIHAGNVVLLFLLLRWLTRRVGPSLLVAALFACHPINVESVAWVAERKNVLCMIFLLGAIGAYAWYAQKPGWRRYLAVTLLFALGLMAKPMVITLPFVLLLLDYWPLSRTPGSPASASGALQMPAGRLLVEKIPLLALSAASAVITVKVQRSGYAVRTLSQFSFGPRLENAIVSYGLYLWKMVWPAGLAFGYPFAANGLPAWKWILSALVLVGITAFAVVLRQRRYLLVGWLWFLGTLVPVIGLVQVGDAAMADRYAYLPLIGIFIMLAFGLADLADIKKVGTAARILPAVCVLVALGGVTLRQMAYWDSEYDLWQRTWEVTENPFAHDALGSALLQPDAAMSRENLAEFDTEQKRRDEAQRHYEQALSLRRKLVESNPYTYLPDMAVTLNNLANLARTENRIAEAKQYYEEGVQIHARLAQQNLDPYPGDRAAALLNLGYLEKNQQENDKALAHFEGALEIYRQLAAQNPEQYLPKVAEALNSTAVTERDRKQMAEARRDYEEALRIRRQLVAGDRATYLPFLAMTLNDLGVLDGAEINTQGAEQHYQEALQLYRELARLEPQTFTRYLAGTLNNLAFLYADENRIAESRQDYTEALGLYRQLYEADPDAYAGDVARVQASLETLRQKERPRSGGGKTPRT
jgi:tetratricopeptide (TPR) repeat protein